MIFKFLLIVTLIRIIWSHISNSSSNNNEKIQERMKHFKTSKNFSIDYENNTFLKDGAPFKYVSGSFHYFRAHPDSWQRKLRTLRASGLNAVSTYVEWSLHNPKENIYNWDGMADLDKFIKLAQQEDLLVILRSGPYIGAERDWGGFPYWLLRKYPKMKLRTADINYLSEVRTWYSQLFSRMNKFLYGNGGPIIMVQIENEYGSLYACDVKYREWLRDETYNYVRDKAVLFTADGPTTGMLDCGTIKNVLPTINCGSVNTFQNDFDLLRKYLPKGPLVNTEFYPGWLTHWQRNMVRLPTDEFLPNYENMLKSSININIYMFFGGTNFGFTAGANDYGSGGYKSDTTSYDYDAPMDEAGDPTEKYYQMRQVTGKYFPLPNITIPLPVPKKHYGTVSLTKGCSLLSKEGRKYLSTGTVKSEKPQTFEQLDQNAGFILYETVLPKFKLDPTILKISDIRDRAYIYVDNQFIGILSRESQAHELPIMAGFGSRLQILVENRGRTNYYYIPNDLKGILSDVHISEQILTNWNMTKYPLDDYIQIINLLEKRPISMNRNYRVIPKNDAIMHHGPTVFYGDFEISKNEIGDTYLDPTGWSKGLVFVNDFNLGRYWPTVGPQITLYVPQEILKTGTNKVVLIEYQRASEAADITFTNVPNLDA